MSIPRTFPVPEGVRRAELLAAMRVFWPGGLDASGVPVLNHANAVAVDGRLEQRRQRIEARAESLTRLLSLPQLAHCDVCDRMTDDPKACSICNDNGVHILLCGECRTLCPQCMEFVCDEHTAHGEQDQCVACVEATRPGAWPSLAPSLIQEAGR